MIDPRQKFSDETIRRFLLGGLNASEQASFEQSLFVDDELLERVRLAELELSDDYATDRLSKSERETFGARFLLTADRRRQVDVSRTLQWKFSGRRSATADKSIWARLTNAFDLRAHPWRYALAGLILMLLLGSALLLTRERSRIARRSPFTPSPAAPKPTGAATPVNLHHSPNSPAPAHTEQPPALPLHEGLTPSVLLDSNTPLEAAPVITTTSDVVTLELRLDQPLADYYDVNVMTAAGESVFMTNAIKRTEPNTIGFNVPASAIDPGDFQIALTSVDGESKQSVGIYYFRVR
jgi:hypothetical protein